MTPRIYNRLLLTIAGIGGMLYGIDVGIISAALLYLGKTIDLSLAQTSIIVAAVLGGSMFSSLVAGFLADWFGRRTMMIVSGVLFVSSVVLIVASHGFPALFAGRFLQGVSGGVIAVVVPLYLTESLSADVRGRGSAVFQLFLTIGIVLAAGIGWYFTRTADSAIAAAHGNAALIVAAEQHAWRGMFQSVAYPGILFLAGTFFLGETPRWLLRKGRPADALQALRRSVDETEAQRVLSEMQAIAAAPTHKTTHVDSLWQRRYIYPFVLACVVLACNQAIGINSILGYLVLILRQGGMSAIHATQGDFAVKLINTLATVVAVALVDRRGRKFLLILGTAGVLCALSAEAVIFRLAEANHRDMSAQVERAVSNNSIHTSLAQIFSSDSAPNGPYSLTVLYSYGKGEHSATVLNTDPNPALTIQPERDAGTLQIKSAVVRTLPPPRTGWWVAFFLALFIAAFAVGPGVVVWLALSELMPTRIRSAGMGIALLINQGVSTLIAGVFLPVSSHYGYSAAFGFWAVCGLIYFLVAVFLLPETKGKTLEEIELLFESREGYQ